MGIVPAICLTETVAPSNSEPWNYDWKRLFVGTVPANFVIDYGTMTGRGYLCNRFLLQQICKMHEQRIGSHRKPGTANWAT